MLQSSAECLCVRLWNMSESTGLKKKIENYLTWEGAFYQSEWVKINSSGVIFVFTLLCVAANTSQLFCMAH